MKQLRVQQKKPAVLVRKKLKIFILNNHPFHFFKETPKRRILYHCIQYLHQIHLPLLDPDHRLLFQLPLRTQLLSLRLIN